MKCERGESLYQIIDAWLGQRLDKKAIGRRLRVSDRRLDELFDSYVSDRDFDQHRQVTVGLPVADRPGELHVLLNDDVEGTDSIPLRRREDLRRALLYAHGVIVQSSLMHLLAVNDYSAAIEELHTMADVRELADLGALCWRESPRLTSDYAVLGDGCIGRRPVRDEEVLLRFVQLPDPFVGGFNTRDPSWCGPNWMEHAMRVGEIAPKMQVLASSGAVIQFEDIVENRRALLSWILNALTIGQVSPGLFDARQSEDLGKILSRIPQLVEGTLPTISPALAYLFRLDLAGPLVSAEHIEALRRNSDRFAAWRTALSAALHAVDDLESQQLNTREWEAAARFRVREVLSGSESALGAEIDKLNPRAIGSAVLRPFTVSSIGLTIGASLGAPITPAAIAGAGGAAVTAGIVETLRSLRGSRARRAEYAHFASF